MLPPDYFVNIGFGGAAAGGAGDITKVSHTFQPSGRCSFAHPRGAPPPKNF
jgi:hypothetical protein